MRIPLSWLKDYIDIDMPAAQLAKVMTLLGLEVDAIEEVNQDTIFEVSFTPNLGHCSSMIGVARELSAATERPYKLPHIEMHEDKKQPASAFVSVRVLNPEKCPRYACRVFRNVKVGPSPHWLKARLEAAGIRSVNNVVDVTNYVMEELGHPLHAFDGDLLRGKQIVVKNGVKGDCFVTLDGKERMLEDSDLMICDQAGPVAFGGIMGGLNSEVGDRTTNVVLEAACFLPNVVRKTSKRVGLITDGSKRFERGCDPNIIPFVLDRAAMLIQQVAGADICEGIIDIAAKEFPKKHVACRLSRINTVLGTQLSAGEVENIFKRLGFTTTLKNDEKFLVVVPTYRNDINEEIDLVEEVARIYGYNNITQPSTYYSSSSIPHNPMFLFEREIRSRLISEGLQEFLTCDLIGPTILDIVKDSEMPESAWVKVVNPTSVEQSILRTSLLPGLLQAVKYNWDHQNHNVSGFEIGRIHFKAGDKYIEQSVAGIVLFGKSRESHWAEKPQDVDFYDLKGIVENLLKELKVKDVAFRESSLPMLHPGRQAAIFSGELKIGTLGEIHPGVQRRLDVPQRIFFAEINLHDLLQVRVTEEKMQPLPIYPGSERDWTLTLQEATPIDDIFNAVYAVTSKYLENISLLDVYRSEKLGEGLKNVTFRFFYRDPDRTMEQEKVDTEHARIVQSVAKVITK